MILQQLTSESDYGLTFTMSLYRRGAMPYSRPRPVYYHIEVISPALTDVLVVCETMDLHEASRRWVNTFNDLTDLQRIGTKAIRAGVPVDVVIDGFRRLREARGIPTTNYLE